MPFTEPYDEIAGLRLENRKLRRLFPLRQPKAFHRIAPDMPLAAQQYCSREINQPLK
jgi:hypothetical protein